jgi:hypothetical protein
VPPFSEDDALDYMVMEAMAVKVSEKRKKQQEESERKQRLKSHRNLRGKKGGQPAPGVTPDARG